MSTPTEQAFTIGLLGANHEFTALLGQAFGSPGDKSDLAFYDRYDAALHQIFTAVAPTGYPDKLKALLQAAALTDIHIMIIDAEVGITGEIGEILVVMDIFAKYFHTRYVALIGNINSANEWRVDEIKKQLPKLAAPTALKDIEIYTIKEKDDFNTFKKKIVEIGLAFPAPDITKSPYVKVLIDHSFPVKGVGTVVLGVVKEGQVKAGEMYDIFPNIKKVILRSIQKNDRDFKTAEPRDRVGLALKGPKAEEIDRNCIFCTLGAFSHSPQMKAKVFVSPYFKPANGKLSPESKQYHLIADLGISPVKFIGGEEIAPGKSGVIEFKLEKELPHDAKGLRGIIADLGPFEKKLRIVGYFEQII